MIGGCGSGVCCACAPLTHRNSNSEISEIRRVTVENPSELLPKAAIVAFRAENVSPGVLAVGGPDERPAEHDRKAGQRTDHQVVEVAEQPVDAAVPEF